MSTTLIRLTDGVLVEVESSPDEPTRIAGSLANKVSTALDDITPVVARAAEVLVSAWKLVDTDVEAEGIEVALGLSFESEGNIYLAKATAGANLTITLKLKPRAKDNAGTA